MDDFEDLRPCDTCGKVSPFHVDHPLAWSDDEDGELDTEQAHWTAAAKLLGAPRCWECCNVLVREQLEAPFVESVARGLEIATRDGVEYPADLLRLADDRLDMIALRQRIEDGRAGTWSSDHQFTPDEGQRP